MSVIVTIWLQGDAEKFEHYAAENKDKLLAI